MPVMSTVIAGKEYTCQRCDKAIKKGEEYYSLAEMIGKNRRKK